MTILHVLSQFEVTGAEVYAVTLAAEQLRRGHRVLIVSDTLHTPTDARYLPFPIGNRRYAQRFRNIRFLTDLIRRENVHVLHAHSRAASWVALWAGRRTGTPLVSTVHGRQHLHASSRTFNVYGRRIIAVNESLREHLVSDLHLPAKNISVIPNGFDFARWQHLPAPVSKPDIYGVSSATPVILIAGRLSGPKGDVVRLFLERAAPSLLKETEVSVQIIGGKNTPGDIAASIDSLNEQFGAGRVCTRDHQTDLRPYYAAADVVVGAGRIAVEALALSKPVLAFGESGYLGRVTAANLAVCIQSNFGDTGTPATPDAAQLIDALRRLLAIGGTTADQDALAKEITDTFAIGPVTDRVAHVYERARIEACAPRSIPVLMYHRVVPEPPGGSKHGVWITARTFERQLRSLRRRGITPITFEWYDRFLRGESTLPDKPVILTFDDGYEDNYTHAFPLLRKYGMSAVIYLVTDPDRRTNFWDPDEPQVPLMSRNQIAELSRAGIEFGSHTVTHLDLSRSGHTEIADELRSSRRWIEDILGKRVISFAYPYGRLTAAARELVEKEGYRYAAAADSGPLWFDEDPLEIRRVQVFPGTDAFGFWKKTQPWYVRYKAGKR